MPSESTSQLSQMCLSSELKNKESVDTTVQLSATNQTMSVLNSTLKAESFTTSLSASITC